MSRLIATNATKMNYLYASHFGQAEVTSSGHLSYTFGTGRVVLVGDYTHTGTTMTGGTVTGYVFIQGSTVYHGISGLNEPAVAFQTYAQTHTGQQLFERMFAGADVLTGSARRDLLNGFAGNDIIAGKDGNDTLAGGDGNDIISGGTGYDLINGGTGSDTISGDEGLDTLLGSIGNDLLKGGAGNDTLNGGANDDRLIGGYGDDVFVFSQGRDVINDLRALDKLVLSDTIWASVTSAQDFVTTHAVVEGLNTIITVGTDKLVLLNYTNLTNLAGQLAHDDIL